MAIVIPSCIDIECKMAINTGHSIQKYTVDTLMMMCQRIRKK